MPWPIPQPGDIADRAASVFESYLPTVYALKNPGQPPAQVDARSNVSQLAVYSRVVDMAMQDAWFFQARSTEELMVDTAIDWLSRHAAIWGVPQIQATAAVGNVVFAGTPTTAIPSGFALSLTGGFTYTTTAGGVIGGGGTVSIAIACATPGSAGSLPSGTILNVVNPLGGLNPQTATVDTNGLVGADAETPDEWRARVLARIRSRGASGNANDFEQWMSEVMPGCISTAMSPGVGFITVAFAMPSGQTWAAPTGGQVTTASAYLNDAQVRKPLGAPVVTVVAATIQVVNYTIHLNPDTVANRAAAVDALTLQMLADATIGATTFMSRMDAALENASGEFSHERTVPSADVTAAATTLSVIGTVTFV